MNRYFRIPSRTYARHPTRPVLPRRLLPLVMLTLAAAALLLTRVPFPPLTTANRPPPLPLPQNHIGPPLSHPDPQIPVNHVDYDDDVPEHSQHQHQDIDGFGHRDVDHESDDQDEDIQDDKQIDSSTDIQQPLLENDLQHLASQAEKIEAQPIEIAQQQTVQSTSVHHDPSQDPVLNLDQSSPSPIRNDTGSEEVDAGNGESVLRLEDDGADDMAVVIADEPDENKTQLADFQHEVSGGADDNDDDDEEDDEDTDEDANVDEAGATSDVRIASDGGELRGADYDEEEDNNNDNEDESDKTDSTDVSATERITDPEDEQGSPQGSTNDMTSPPTTRLRSETRSWTGDEKQCEHILLFSVMHTESSWLLNSVEKCRYVAAGAETIGTKALFEETEAWSHAGTVLSGLTGREVGAYLQKGSVKVLSTEIAERVEEVRELVKAGLEMGVPVVVLTGEVDDCYTEVLEEGGDGGGGDWGAHREVAERGIEEFKEMVGVFYGLVKEVVKGVEGQVDVLEVDGVQEDERIWLERGGCFVKNCESGMDG